MKDLHFPDRDSIAQAAEAVQEIISGPWQKQMKEIQEYLDLSKACKMQASECISNIRRILDFDGIHRLIPEHAPAAIHNISRTLLQQPDKNRALSAIQIHLNRIHDPF